LGKIELWSDSMLDWIFFHFWIDSIIMVALCNMADHYIFLCDFYLSSFFPRLISAAVDWMSTILRRMVWP